MGATVRSTAIKNTVIRAFLTIKGVKFAHYSYCKYRHDVFIKFNGDTYYQANDRDILIS
jgi:hypothetical protein